MNENKKQNNNHLQNLDLYSGALTSIGLNAGLGTYALSKMLESNKNMLQNTSDRKIYVNYLQNKLIDLHKQDTSNPKVKDEIAKIEKHLEPFKLPESFGKNQYDPYPFTMKVDVDKDYLNEAKKERIKTFEKLDNLHAKTLKTAKGFGALGGLGVAGFTYSKYRDNKRLGELKKTSSLMNNSNNDDKDNQEAVNEVLQDKRSYIAPVGASMLGGGLILNHIAKKTTDLNKENEKKYKFHLNESAMYSKKADGALSKINDLKKENEELKNNKDIPKAQIEKRTNSNLNTIKTLEQESSEHLAKRNEHYLKGLNNLVGINKNPAPYLSQTASTLKWGSIPMLGIGSYYLLNKNKDNKPNVTEDDNKKYNTISSGLIAGGALATIAGMYRPFIKGSAKSVKKLVDSVQDLDSIKLDNTEAGLLSGLKKVRTENDANEFAENVKDKINKGKDIVNNFPYKRDVQLSALGQGMMSAGGLGAFLTARPDEIEKKKEEISNRKLLKQSSVIAHGAELLGSGLGFHVAQNVIAKTKIHSGESGKRFSNYIKEGNTGKTNLNPVQSFLRGLERGTINVDDSIIASEGKKFGRDLKESGVNLDKLNYYDKKFLHHYNNGEFDKALIHAPYSNIAHTFIIGNPTYQAILGKHVINKAVRNLSKQDLKEIQEMYKKTSLHHFVTGMGGDAKGEYNSKISPLGNKAFNIIGKAYKKITDKLPFKPSKEFKHNAKIGDVAAKAGQALGIVGSLHVDPAVGMLNIAKPALFSGKVGEYMNKPSGYYLKSTFARSLSGLPAPSGKAGVASEFTLSPAFNQFETIAHDKGTLAREILKRGLTKKEFENIINSNEVKDSLADPIAKTKNSNIEAKKELMGINNLDKSILDNSHNISSDLKSKSTQTARKGIENRHVEQEDVNSLASDLLTEQANKAYGSAANKIVGSNIDEAEKLKQTRDKYDSYLNKLMLPAVVGGTGTFMAPQVISDYKKHKEEKRKLYKHSSTNNNQDSYSSDIAIGTAGGLGIGGYMNFVHNKNKEANINSFTSMINSLKEENPVKAMEMLKSIKNDKNYSSFIDTKEFKELEKNIERHSKQYIIHARNGDAAQELFKKKNELDSKKIKIDYDNPKTFNQMIYGFGKESLNQIKENAKDIAASANPKDFAARMKTKLNNHVLKEIDNWEKVQDLKDKVIKHNQKYQKDFYNEFKNGGLKNDLDNLETSLKQKIKTPISLKVRNLGGGAALGALAGLGVHKITEASNKASYSKDDPAYNSKSSLLAPTLLGVGVGGLAGAKMSKAIKGMKSKYLGSLLDSKAIDPSNKMSAVSFLDLGDKAGDEALKMKAHHYAKDLKDFNPDFDELKQVVSKDNNKINPSDIKFITPMGLTGGYVGAQLAMENDIHKKDNNRLYKASEYNKQDIDNTDKMYYGAPLALGVGGGLLHGYYSGKDKKTSQELFYDEYKKGVGKLKNIDDNDFGKSKMHVEGVIQLSKDLNELGMKKHLENNKHYNDLHKHIENYNRILQENDPYEREATNDLESAVKLRRDYLSAINKNKNIKENPELKDKVLNKMTEALYNMSTPEEVAKKHMEGVEALNDEYDHIRNNAKALKKHIIEYEPTVDKNFKSITRRNIMKGGLIGGALGALGSAAIYHDLNKNN